MIRLVVHTKKNMYIKLKIDTKPIPEEKLYLGTQTKVV